MKRKRADGCIGWLRDFEEEDEDSLMERRRREIKEREIENAERLLSIGERTFLGDQRALRHALHRDEVEENDEETLSTKCLERSEDEKKEEEDDEEQEKKKKKRDVLRSYLGCFSPLVFVSFPFDLLLFLFFHRVNVSWNKYISP